MRTIAAVVVVVLLCGVSFALGRVADGGGARTESPCIVSWDENDGDSTLCILTPEAARREHAAAPTEYLYPPEQTSRNLLLDLAQARCAMRVFEDGSAIPETDDATRDKCYMRILGEPLFR